MVLLISNMPSGVKQIAVTKAGCASPASLLLRLVVRRTGKWSAGGETTGTQPERNDRCRAAGGSTPNIRCCADAARDERAVCGVEQRGREGFPYLNGEHDLHVESFRLGDTGYVLSSLSMSVEKTERE
jgi:hypothetical protein